MKLLQPIVEVFHTILSEKKSITCAVDRAQTGDKHGSIHLRLGDLFLSQWKTSKVWYNDMQLSCSDDSVTQACNLKSQCQPLLPKDLNTLRRQEQSPNSFQKCHGLWRHNMCVCVCVCTGSCIHINAEQISTDCLTRSSAGHPRSFPVIMTFVFSAVSSWEAQAFPV